MKPTGQTLPDLPLEAWEQSKITLNLYMQIVGKIRLATMPRKNHWWYLTLYVSPTGFTTGPMPTNDGFDTFEITFNLLDHQLEIVTSQGERATIKLEDGLSVADFYARLFATLDGLGIHVTIIDHSFDLPEIEDEPFTQMTQYATYQPAYVERFWRVMMWVDSVLKEWSGRSYSKTNPVHLYWHHLDLVVTRFSGKKGPALPPDMRLSDKDAYSHEVISAGFWAGDPVVRAPAFYVYAYPSPDGLDQEPLQPAAARWVDNNGSPSATLMYDDLRQEADPRAALLAFLESAYQGAAKLAGWPVAELTVPPLDEL